jgi:rhodanese-related sulfurtransferase/DNA-binding transcriptional ArsR family regulator
MSTPRTPKQQVFEQLAKIGTAFSNPVRLEVLELLAQGEQTVQAMAQLTGASIANTSQHLQKLKSAGLINGLKQGQQVFYRLAGDEVVALLAAFTKVGQAHVAEIERIVRLYFLSKDEFEPVASDELLDRTLRGLVTVLDVRPPDEFASGHIPGAVNIPISELERRLRELPKGREVVAYCRGPFCLMSYDAVQLLRQRGIRARRLQEGMPEWRLAGLPVE